MQKDLGDKIDKLDSFMWGPKLEYISKCMCKLKYLQIGKNP